MIGVGRRAASYFFGPKNATMPKSTVGCVFEPLVLFSKNGWSDQSFRNSSRLSSQSVTLYSLVKVNSLSFCLVPVEKPSISSKYSTRDAIAYFLPIA